MPNKRYRIALPAACRLSNQKLAKHTVIKDFKLSGFIKADQYQKFMIHPKKYPHKRQKTVMPALPMLGKTFFKTPAEAPARPHDSICQKVHGPWPMKKFDTRADAAPTINPFLEPITKPETITTKVVA